MKKLNIHEIIGWYGALAILIAYALISFDFIIADSYIYQVLNATGSLGIIHISYIKKVHQSVVLNVMWLLIAFVAIIRLVV
jgi:hypothetical protein